MSREQNRKFLLFEKIKKGGQKNEKNRKEKFSVLVAEW
tara:strand:- start:104 stop:217 length:114 start_codon:yes stop_codon:yes gene_type:complete